MYELELQTSKQQTKEGTRMQRAYIQYLDAYGEWKTTERMEISAAEAEVAAMLSFGVEAFIRVCN